MRSEAAPSSVATRPAISAPVAKPSSGGSSHVVVAMAAPNAPRPNSPAWPSDTWPVDEARKLTLRASTAYTGMSDNRKASESPTASGIATVRMSTATRGTEPFSTRPAPLRAAREESTSVGSSRTSESLPSVANPLPRLPNKPCGRNSSTATSTRKTNSSGEPGVPPQYRRVRLSNTPMASPPITAPGRLTIPPIIAAAKPCGSTAVRNPGVNVWVVHPAVTPANAPRKPATPHATISRRRGSSPTMFAPSRLSAPARRASPRRVRSRPTHSVSAATARVAITSIRVGVMTTPSTSIPSPLTGVGKGRVPPR